MMHAIFETPGSESLGRDVFTNGERQILMPRHQPVRVRRLVEVDRAYGARMPVEVWSDEIAQQIGTCQTGDVGNSQDSPFSCATDWTERTDKALALRGVQDVMNDFEAVDFDFVGHLESKDWDLSSRSWFANLTR